MTRRFRRDLRLLQAGTACSVIAFVVFAVTGFTQSTGSSRFHEITVGRVNVVDADGTLRLVISNRDRMHPGVMDGVMIDRPRPVAGLLFFNEEGDEVGGLTVTGREVDGRPRASAQLAFDQFKQDQTVAITYSETDGRRTAGLQVWDRSDTPLTDLIRQLNAANALEDPAAREEAIQTARASAPPGPRRVFVGRTPEHAATVSLADADGNPRLTLTVEADGRASIAFLDADGNVTRRVPEAP